MTASWLLQVFFAMAARRFISASGQIDSRDRTRASRATCENSCAPFDNGNRKVAGIFQAAVRSEASLRSSQTVLSDSAFSNPSTAARGQASPVPCEFHKCALQGFLNQPDQTSIPGLTWEK